MKTLSAKIKNGALAIFLTGLIFPSGFSYAQIQSLSPEAKAQALLQAARAEHAQSGIADTESSKSDTLRDQRAIVIRVEGDVKILKANTEEWKSAKKEMILETGDQLLTGENSFIEFSYDEFFLNIAKIDQKTKAEFRSIEPTDLYMEDGTIFSALDGLGGNKYSISTPTAVAAVRGTHLYTTAENGAFVDVAVVPDSREYQSSVEVIFEGQNFVIQEGEQLAFGGDAPKIEAVRPEIGSFAMTTMNHVQENYQGFREGGFQLMKENRPEEMPALTGSDERKTVYDGNPPGDNGPGSPMDSNLQGGSGGDFRNMGAPDAFIDQALYSPDQDLVAPMMLPMMYHDPANPSETYTANFGNFSATTGPLAGYDPTLAQTPDSYANMPHDPSMYAAMPAGVPMPGYDPAMTAGAATSYYDPATMTGAYATYDPNMAYVPPPTDTYMPPPDSYIPPPDTYYSSQDTAQYTTYTPPPAGGTCTDEYGHSYPC
ncbi:MAG: hypothetical protein HYZ85_01705 [Candidatus Omnitrophica bacterium]|nr:hypothetical protein [Candidatus Omnitrophota bacterium]